MLTVKVRDLLRPERETIGVIDRGFVCAETSCLGRNRSRQRQAALVRYRIIVLRRDFTKVVMVVGIRGGEQKSWPERRIQAQHRIPGPEIESARHRRSGHRHEGVGYLVMPRRIAEAGAFNLT